MEGRREDSESSRCRRAAQNPEAGDRTSRPFPSSSENWYWYPHVHATASPLETLSLLSRNRALPASTASAPPTRSGAARPSAPLRSAAAPVEGESPPRAPVVGRGEDDRYVVAEAASGPGRAGPPAVSSDRIYGAVPVESLGGIYDLVVIGGGPAGVAGAIKAAQMGRRAMLIDRPKFYARVLPNGLDPFFGGPTGLFSKALRDAAKNTNVEAMTAQNMDSDVIWKQIAKDVVKLATRNSEGQCRTLARYGIDYLQGSARLLGEDDEANVAALEKFGNDLDNPDDGLRSVMVSNAGLLDKNGNLLDQSEAVVSGTKVLVCTGSKSARLPGIPFEQSHRIFDSDTIGLLGYLPRSVTISGLGIIGVEFANIFNALGVKDVTILASGSIDGSIKKLGMDPDVANELVRILKKSGVDVLEGTTVKEFTYVPPPGADDELIEMRLNDGSTVRTDLFFAAVGRSPVGGDEEAGLASGGVEVADRGTVEVDGKTLATSSANVYAAGDVIGPPALASTGVEQARRAVAGMFCEGDDDADPAREANPDNPLTIGVWTIPEMGFYGLTKERAEREGRDVVEGTAGYDRCIRGRVFAPDGLLKLVVDSDEGTVLGVHLIGKEAAELVHYGMALVKGGTTVFEMLSDTVYTAMTFHELFGEAALDANDKLAFGVEWQEIFDVLGRRCRRGTDDDLDAGRLRERFDAIDRDGSGGLDEAEVRALFASMGRPASKRVVANIMRLSDLDGNGTIDFDEFKAIFDRIARRAKIPRPSRSRV